MAIAYQYDASGYFAGEIEDHGGPLPNNSAHMAPRTQDGHIPHWNGESWELVEDHKGEEGYMNGLPYIIKDYGPLSEGWSKTQPLPSQEELDAVRSGKILARLTEIDAACVRPLRAAAQGKAGQADKDKLAALDAEVEFLRNELKTLAASA